MPLLIFAVPPGIVYTVGGCAMPEIRLKKERFFLAVKLWAVLLVFLALLPEKVALMVLRKPEFFAVAHLVAYFILAFLLCLFLRFQRIFLSLRMRSITIFSLTLLFSMICGGVTEAVQVLTPDRGPDWFDLGCDLLGALSGILFFFLFSRTRLFRKIPALKQILPSLSKS